MMSLVDYKLSFVNDFRDKVMGTDVKEFINDWKSKAIQQIKQKHMNARKAFVHYALMVYEEFVKKLKKKNQKFRK